MRRIFMWIVLLPAVLAIVVFALNNSSAIAIDLWPFGIVVEMPVYLAFILVLSIGAFLGGFVSIVSGAKARALHRASTYEAEVKIRELEKLKSRCETLEAEIKRLKSESQPTLPAQGGGSKIISSALN
ncbi:MAG: LapA family protein [Rhodospirillaceae bacterium]|nr:LapA family protein [Rhodospirillaceae bacterium]